MANEKHTPRIIRMLRVSNCDSEAEVIVADLLEVCKDAAYASAPHADEDARMPYALWKRLHAVLAKAQKE